MSVFWCVINIVRSIPALLLFFKSSCHQEICDDLFRNGCKKASWWELHKTLMNNCAFRSIFYYRTNKCAPFITKLSKLLLCPETTIGVDAEYIDGGMIIWHGFSTIVYAKKIGKNFTVYQQVTIGRGKSINGNSIPIIGDNVTVYAGAIIVGGVHIGNNVSIGAGAVVVNDVPDNTTVVGAPVRYISKQL